MKLKSSLMKVLKVTVLCSLLAMNACYKSNGRRMTPPEEYTGEIFNGEMATLQNSNAVDILFVIDNSESMAIHQDKLAASIQHFVKAFETNNKLDYHVGIVPIYDSSRYGTKVKTFNPNGYLLPLKGDTGSKPNNYYTREHNNSSLLAESIHIGVIPLKDANGVDQGPQLEEIFSPIYATFTEPAVSAETNKGFYRPEARLAVIIITDADDTSPGLSGSDLDYFLKALKQDPMGEKISTFGVLADRNDKECVKVDPGLTDKPQRILDFIDASGGTVMSLCKGDYASLLASIGQQIESKTQKQQFQLSGIPEFSTLRVSIGGEELAPGPKTWSFDPTLNRITITFVPKSSKPEDRTVKIMYTKVNIENYRNGRAKKYEQPLGVPAQQR